MMGVVVSLLVVLFSLMLSFFLSIANLQLLVEGDFMNKAMNNAMVHSLRFGQMAARAHELSLKVGEPNTAQLNAGYLRKINQRTSSELDYSIELTPDNQIHADIDVH